MVDKAVWSIVLSFVVTAIAASRRVFLGICSSGRYHTDRML